MAVGRSLLALALLVLGLAAAPAQASLKESYRRGLEAVEAADWASAESALREAIAVRDAEARRLPLKRIFAPYLPHYYLGLALERQGDCRGALAEWQTSRDHQAVVGLEVFGDLEKREAACSERIEELDAVQDKTRAALERVAESAIWLADPSRTSLLQHGWQTGRGTLGQRVEAARTRMDEIEAKIAQALSAQDPELARESLRMAEETADMLAQAREDAATLLERAKDEQALRRERIAEVKQLGTRVEQLLRTKSPLPPSFRGQRQKMESLLSGTRSLPDSASLSQIEGLEERLEGFRRQLERSTSPPPGQLRSGAIAYLRADYQEVLDRFEEIPYKDPKARAHCLLLRSAAAFALHVASGDDGGAYLHLAREDVLATKNEDPELVPAPSAYSPRFVRFFASVLPPPEELETPKSGAMTSREQATSEARERQVPGSPSTSGG